MRNSKDWNAALHTAVQAARFGREVLMHYYVRQLEQIEAKVQAGLVSEADRESERVIFSHLRKFFPDDDFLGEESTKDLSLVSATSQQSGRWIIDPLDGTTNYIHHFPVWCISIGYEWQGQMQLAVVDVPMMNEVYTAIRGQGVWLNGQPLHVSSTAKVEDSLLATGFFGEHESNLQEQIQIFSKVVRQSRGIRRAGAAAYDLCLVARGVFDAYWEKGLKPWDSAAGLLLVEEAGGKVCTYRGKPYHPFHNSLIAGNAQMVQNLLHMIQPIIAKDSD